MLLTADRVIYNGYAYTDVGIEISDDGHIVAVGMLPQLGKPDRVLEGKVLLPGMVNAHSHAFQRLLRGRTQFVGPHEDNFWTWRDAMYWVSGCLDPHGVYVASRQAFLEMLLAGVTTVGEFHYLLNQPDGEPYEDVHRLSDAVVHAARDVGIRLSLIRVVYLRGDFDSELSPQQKRFADPGVDVACDRFDDLVHRLIEYRDPRVSWALAAHSLRGVSYEALMSLRLRLSHMPFHMHISEQRREVEACLRKHQASPVHLLAKNGLLDSCVTLVHATHLEEGEADAIAKSGALVCVCPSTEADLGDGLAPAGSLYHRGVQLCLGTDGQTKVSLLGEAARVEMHERMRVEQRNVLAKADGDSVAASLLEMATVHGATSLGIETGMLRAGKWADLVALDLDDPALCGCDEWSLLPGIMFSADSRAVRDVIVGGRFVIENGEHPQKGRAASDYSALSAQIYADLQASDAPAADDADGA